MKRNVRFISPEEFSDLKITGRKKKAAGIPAIISSLNHIGRERGLWSGMKILGKMNQPDGFDCPNCAWPDPDGKRSFCEYCENGVKGLAGAITKNKVTPEFFQQYTVEEISEKSDYWLGKQGRITQPFYLAEDSSNYAAISWEDAFRKIADKLKKLDSPNEACFYTSGKASNEAAFLYQLFARQLGTNNLPDSSNLCHEASGKALTETLGIGKGTATLADFDQAEVIVVIGQNPGSNHPRMLSALESCKKNGGKIVTVNPMPEAGNMAFVNPQSLGSVLKNGTRLTDLYLQVKINGDVALLKAVMLLLLEEEEKHRGSVFDHDFIEKHTSGFQEFITELKKTNLQEAITASGLSEKKVREFIKLLKEKKRIIFCWALGITQHENGVDTIREIVNLLLLKGSIGRSGSGTCPVRGHSNVQGDRTMGVVKKPAPWLLKNLHARFSFEPPVETGLDAVEAAQAMHQGKIKVFMALGGNFASAISDSNYSCNAIQNCELTVQVSTKLNRSHLVTGKEAIILPCLTRSERISNGRQPQFVSIENSMGIVHVSKGSFKPASDQLLSEPAIVARLGQELFGNSPVNWKEMLENYDLIRDHIEAVIPGFDEYNKRVRYPSGFYLPNAARNCEFKTQVGKALFTINAIPKRKIANDRLIMMSVRSHDQFNTSIHGLDDRYRGIKNERRVVLMNKADMQKLQLKQKDVVDITSFFNGEERLARNFKVVEYTIAEGCVATYFPEANVLVPLKSVGKKSNTPTSKFVEVSIRKS